MPELSPLLVLSIVLVAGAAFGALAKRFRLPSVTGQILVGILIGPAVLGLITIDQIHHLSPVIDFALGLMAVAVGSHLHFARLRNARRRLLYLVLFEAALTPLLVYLAVAFVPGTSWQMGLLLAMIAVSTAPATILAIVKETRSKGVFVKTLLAATALNNLACVCLFELAHAAGQASFLAGADPGVAVLFLAPLRQILFSALLGGGAGIVLILATRRIVRTDRLTAASMVALLLTVGLAEYMDVSPLLSCLFLGMTLANVTPDKEEIGHAVFDNFEYAIFAVFFTLAGAELDFAHIVPGGVLALIVFAARAAGKLGAAHVAMRIAGATDRVRTWLGPALLPQAGLAIGLTLLVTEDPAFQSIHSMFLAVVLTVVILNEIVGPILTRFALAKSGDLRKDRPRLIDFLHEENIVTDLAAATKDEAIDRLIDVLVRTTAAPVTADELREKIRAREAQGSTCLGDGLAIPHARVKDGEAMVGVMGISREGLRFETPDRRPVHCMILLVTPDAARDHHLEVLAAFARVVGADPGRQQQLYHAESSAHAYELLHADEESEDFNYFLEDDEAEA